MERVPSFLSASKMNVIDEEPEEEEVDEVDNDLEEDEEPFRQVDSVDDLNYSSDDKENIMVDVSLFSSPSPPKGIMCDSDEAPAASRERTNSSGGNSTSPALRRRSPLPFQNQLEYWQLQSHHSFATSSLSPPLQQISSNLMAAEQSSIHTPTRTPERNKALKRDRVHALPATIGTGTPPSSGTKPSSNSKRPPTHPSSNTPPARFSLFGFQRSPETTRHSNNRTTTTPPMTEPQVSVPKRRHKRSTDSLEQFFDRDKSYINNKRCSAQPVSGGAPTAAHDSTAPYHPKTELHRICHDVVSVEELTELASGIIPQSNSRGPNFPLSRVRRGSSDDSSAFASLATRDDMGRLPIHVLSENRNLILSNFACIPEDYEDMKNNESCNGSGRQAVQVSQKASSLAMHNLPPSPFDLSTSAAGAPEREYDIGTFAKDFVLDLVNIYPASMTVQDYDGFIPFARVVAQWIDHVHAREFDGTGAGNNRWHQYAGGGVGGGGNGEYHISQLGHAVTKSISKTKASLSRAVQMQSPPFSLTHLSTRSRFNSDFSSNASVLYVTSPKSLELDFDSTAADGSPPPLGDPEIGKVQPASIDAAEKGGLRAKRPGHPPRRRLNSSTSGTYSDSDTRDKQCPTKLRITPHVTWCLHMLSAILEYLDEAEDDDTMSIMFLSHQKNVQPITANKRAQGKPSELGVNSVVNGGDRPIPPPLLATEKKGGGGVRRTSETVAMAIVQSVASIPQLIKTLLLIEDDTERDRVFALPVVRRVVLSNHSIGKWLTAMLASKNKRVAQRAVDYLTLLSNASDEEKSGVKWTDAKSRSARSLRKRENELYESVSHLDGLIPSMLALDERMVEQAATTKVVRKVLDKMISRPFAVSIVFFDMLFLAVLIVTFRHGVHGYLNGFDPDYIIKFLYVTNTSIFYFIIRELGKVVSLCMIAKEIFGLKHFWSFWNIVDGLSIFMALVSTTLVRVCVNQGGGDLAVDRVSRRALLAVTTGLLWLRVLGLLKTINMQLATFVLAIVQITRDILWFLLILSVAVVSFAQMFYTLLLPPSCAVNEREDDDRQCLQAEYYLKVYTILLGDFGVFDREDFTTVFSVVLIIIFSFMVVIILLNVLIAIVSDSYEKCLLRSENLFGRARVVLLAELVAFQHLLRKSPEKSSENDKPTAHQRPVVRFHTFRVFRTDGQRTQGSCIFFVLSAVVVLLWVFGETLGYVYADRYVDFTFSVSSILINIVLLMGIIKFLSHGATNAVTHPREEEKSVRANNSMSRLYACWYKNSIQKVMLRLLGTSEKTAHFCKTGRVEDEWRGRVRHLQGEMIRATGESAARTKAQVEELEQNVRDLDTRMKAELKSIQHQVIESETRVMTEIRASEQRMQALINEGMNSIVSSISSQVVSQIQFSKGVEQGNG